MSNKRYGEIYNIITAVRNFYNNKMTQHEDLAAYYSRCRILLFVKSGAYRLADKEAPEHTDEFHAVLFITALNSNYSEYINTFKNKVCAHGRRPWAMPTRTRPTSLWEGPSTEELPRTRRSETFSRPVGVGERVQLGEASGAAGVRAEERRGVMKPPVRVRRGQALPIGIGRPPPQRERGGTVQEYGTRYGACNNCGEEGHYGYECKKPPRKNAPARHPSSEK